MRGGDNSTQSTLIDPEGTEEWVWCIGRLWYSPERDLIRGGRG